MGESFSSRNTRRGRLTSRSVTSGRPTLSTAPIVDDRRTARLPARRCVLSRGRYDVPTQSSSDRATRSRWDEAEVTAGRRIVDERGFELEGVGIGGSFAGHHRCASAPRCRSPAGLNLPPPPTCQPIPPGSGIRREDVSRGSTRPPVSPADVRLTLDDSWGHGAVARNAVRRPMRASGATVRTLSQPGESASAPVAPARRSLPRGCESDGVRASSCWDSRWPTSCLGSASTSSSREALLPLDLTDRPKHEFDDARLHSRKEERAVGARDGGRSTRAAWHSIAPVALAAVPENEQRVVADV
jgi:hypothetical protein